MSRGLSANVLAQVASASVQPVLFFYGEFTTGTIRLWSGIGNISWAGQTWTGAGGLIGLSNIEETEEIRASGVTVTFTGIPAESISLVLGSVTQGKIGRIYLGFLSGGSIVVDPWVIFEGRIDTPVISEDAEIATIGITYESRMIDLQRPRVARYTDQEQQREYPGDLGMEFVAALQDAQVPWGRKANNVPASSDKTDDTGGGSSEGFA